MILPSLRRLVLPAILAIAAPLSIAQEAGAPPAPPSTDTSAPTEAGPAEIARAMEGLRSRFFEDREAARESLRRIGSPAVPALIGLLNDDRPTLQIHATELLGEIGSPAAVPALLQVLWREDPVLSSTAETSLIRIGEPARAALEAERAKSPGNEERIDVILGFLSQRQVEAILNACITKKYGVGHFEGQFKAIEQMTPRPTAVLLKMYLDPEYEFTSVTDDDIRRGNMRVLAGEALGDLADPSAVPILKKALEDKKGEGLRGSYGHDAAIFSLYKLGEKSYVEAERARLEAPPPESRDWDNLASLYTRIGEHALGLQAYEEQMKRSKPENMSPISFYNLACLYSVNGKKPEAVRALRTAAERGYRDWDWVERDGDLTNIRLEADYLELIKAGRAEEAAEDPPDELPPDGGVEGP